LPRPVEESFDQQVWGAEGALGSFMPFSKFWRKSQHLSKVICVCCSFILKYWAYYVDVLGERE